MAKGEDGSAKANAIELSESDDEENEDTLDGLSLVMTNKRKRKKPVRYIDEEDDDEDDDDDGDDEDDDEDDDDDDDEENEDDSRDGRMSPSRSNKTKRSHSISRRSTRRKRGYLSSSDDEEVSPSKASKDDTEAKARRKRLKERTSYVSAPSDTLHRAPRRRTRPTQKGEAIGDLLVYGDSLTWAIRHDKFEKTEKTWANRLKPRLLGQGFRLIQNCFFERTTAYDDFPDDDFGWNAGAEPHHFNGLYHFGVVFSSHSPLWLILMLGTHDLKTRVRMQAIEQMTIQREQRQAKAKTNSKAKASDSGNGDAQDDTNEFENDDDVEDDEEEDDDDDDDEEGGEENQTKKRRPKVQFTAQNVAENCAQIALKARTMFKGHCHEGDLKIMLVVPPELRLTEVAKQFGFDEESVRIAKHFPRAFEKVCDKYNLFYTHCPIDMDESVDGIHLTTRHQQKLAESIWDTMKGSIPRTIRAPERLQIK